MMGEAFTRRGRRTDDFAVDHLAVGRVSGRCASSTSTATRPPPAALVARITDLAGDDHFKFMEVCGGHTHTIYRHGIEHVLPESRGAGARARLPGVRDPDGPGRRRHRRRRDARRHLHLVRRHDARARQPRQPARSQGPRRRRALRLLPARRAAASPIENPDREVVFFAVGFETTAPSTAVTLLQRPRARRHQLHACSATTSRSSRPSRRSSSRPTCASTASSAPATCRPSSATARTGSCPSSTASRWSPPGSSRSTSCRRSPCCCRRSARAAARSRTSTHAWSATRATRGRWQILAEVFELRPHFEWRGLGFISQSALRLRPEFAALRRRTALRGPGRAGRRPEGVPVRRGPQGRDQAVGVQGVRHRVHAGDARSAPAWCRPRGRARRTTTSAGSTAKPRSRWGGPAPIDRVAV